MLVFPSSTQVKGTEEAIIIIGCHSIVEYSIQIDGGQYA